MAANVAVEEYRLQTMYRYDMLRTLSSKTSWCRIQSVYQHCNRKLLTAREDRYKGVHVDLELQENLVQCSSVEYFKKSLNESMLKWHTSGNTAAWLRIPITSSQLIPIAAGKGFKFHHAEGNHSVLCLWMDPATESMLPRFATHQVGVAGCVLREDTEEVLMIRDQHRPYASWAFPGGLADLGEDISDTAKREVFEETGVDSEFLGILTIRQQHQQPSAFGRSDLYFVCLMRALTHTLRPDPAEVSDCRWVSLQDVLGDTTHTGITRRVAQLVDITSKDRGLLFSQERLQSIFKKTWYSLYHLELPEMKESDYTSHFVDGKQR